MLIEISLNICVNTQISFRESHHLAGKAVALAESKGIPLLELSVQQLKTIRYIKSKSLIEMK